MRNQRFAMILLIAGLFLPVSTRQAFGETPDEPKAFLQDDLLDRLTGKWNVTRKIHGKIVRQKAEARWVLNHRFLQLHLYGGPKADPYEALVMIGYDDGTKHYVAHWCDTFGGGFSIMGTGKRSGDAIAFTFPYPAGNFYNTFTWDPATKGWTCLGESTGKDGKRVFFAEDILTRR